VVPLRTCSPCPVRRRTVARLVGALVHKTRAAGEAALEFSKVHVSPVRRFQAPGRPEPAHRTTGNGQPTKVPSPALRSVRGFTDANHRLKARRWVAAVAARR
jgi:hypothetical protein